MRRNRSYPQSWAWRNRGLDCWPHGQNNLLSHSATEGLKILVTCEDTADMADAQDDQLDLGLENLCLAVTEQALG